MTWSEVFSNWRRSVPHYKPAAIAVLLDMIEAGEVQEDGYFPYSHFDARFRQLLQPFDPAGANRSFMPFFHLWNGDRVWSFRKDGRPSLPPGEAREHVSSYADGAVLDPDLFQVAGTPNGRRDIRQALVYVLSDDTSSPARALVGRLGGSLPSHGSYLLTWNPARFTPDRWSELPDQIAATRSGEVVTRSWSTGGTRNIERGSRLFLLVQGEEPRGIMAAGYAHSGVYEGSDWEDSSRTDTYIDVAFEVILPRENVLPHATLTTGVLGSVHWATQRSGIEIRPRRGVTVSADPAMELEEVWHRHLYGLRHPFAAIEPQEITAVAIEGRRKLRTHMIKERDPDIVRAKKQQAAELRCEVCRFSFIEVYGEEFIECHHLQPISEIEEEHETTLADLALVCSNCHRMLHARGQIRTLDELRQVMRGCGGEAAHA